MPNAGVPEDAWKHLAHRQGTGDWRGGVALFVELFGVGGDLVDIGEVVSERLPRGIKSSRSSIASVMISSVVAVIPTSTSWSRGSLNPLALARIRPIRRLDEDEAEAAEKALKAP